ncbi:MAG TPA: helix-turn-helix domain-containing protein [Chitinophagaceae bacterium]|nr:helix-turn-helix domain-containing protein [Chitinophagaceae bacterium]
MSNTQKILKDLQKGKKVSALDGFTKYNTVRLGGLIHQLRKQGFNIQTQIIKKKKKQYAVYTL